MTLEQYITAVESLSGYFGVVGMFGGNPALHPQFGEMCTVLRGNVPFEQRGLWCNHPRGQGHHMRITFNPIHSNLNVHLVREAYDEFARDWPECVPYLKGLDPSWPECENIYDANERARRIGDARHSPVWTAMQDLISEDEAWEKIARCDVNQFWSAMICAFRGELRAFFCEIAGAQAMLHQANPEYPDHGLPVTPGWWNQGMQAFDAQVRYHCMACGFPMRGYGELAVGGAKEQVTKTHADIFKPKSPGRVVELVDHRNQLNEDGLACGTDYIQNGSK